MSLFHVLNVVLKPQPVSKGPRQDPGSRPCLPLCGLQSCCPLPMRRSWSPVKVEGGSCAGGGWSTPI